MSCMKTLSELTGTWTGTNGFRLMPEDQLAEYAATVSVSSGAGGHLTSVAYSWEHPADGRQEGLLVIGSTGEGDALTALWGDSWHQQPAPTVLSGSLHGGAVVELEVGYGGGWLWRIRLDASDADTLGLRMDNVVPAAHARDAVPAGPYPVMVMTVRRDRAA